MWCPRIADFVSVNIYQVLCRWISLRLCVSEYLSEYLSDFMSVLSIRLWAGVCLSSFEPMIQTVAMAWDFACVADSLQLVWTSSWADQSSKVKLNVRCPLITRNRILLEQWFGIWFELLNCAILTCYELWLKKLCNPSNQAYTLWTNLNDYMGHENGQNMSWNKLI